MRTTGCKKGPLFVRDKVYVDSLRKIAPPGFPGEAVSVRKENDHIMHNLYRC